MREPVFRKSPRAADPLVEAAAARLQARLGSLTATGPEGGALTWHDIARIALGDLSSTRVRDALSADRLDEALVAVPLKATGAVGDAPRAVSPEVTYRGPVWKTLFSIENLED